MGKASSAKKVARVARAGGRVSGVRQRNLAFPAAIAGILVAGIGLVGFAWNDHRDSASSEPPVANEDHWHSAFGVYVCDSFLPDQAENHDSVGIHTHGDGVIHIHPFSDAGGGDNATLGQFLEGTGIDIELSDDELKVGEETWKSGETKCGDEDGQLVVARWKDVQTTDNNPTIIEDDLTDLRFRDDGEGYVIAFVPEDKFEDIPKPTSAGDLTALGAADTENPSGTTTVPEAPAGGDTTLPVDPNAPTTLPPDPNAVTTLPPDPNATTPTTVP